jgi:hypothetical protein
MYGALHPRVRPARGCFRTLVREDEQKPRTPLLAHVHAPRRLARSQLSGNMAGESR